MEPSLRSGSCIARNIPRTHEQLTDNALTRWLRLGLAVRSCRHGQKNPHHPRSPRDTEPVRSLLKGFIDRVFLPGFAFKYRQGSPWWDKYLTGRSAHVIATMDTPPWYFRLVYKDAGINQIKRTILQYCGISPVKVTRIGRVKDAAETRKQAWLAKAREFGRSA